MGVDALNDLAIQFKDESQHTVSRRMLRPEIDREVAEIFRLFIHDQTFGPAFSSPGRG